MVMTGPRGNWSDNSFLERTIAKLGLTAKVSFTRGSQRMYPEARGRRFKRDVWVRRTSPDGGGAGGGEFAADHSEVRGGTDWRARAPEPLIRWVGYESTFYTLRPCTWRSSHRPE